MNVRVPSVVYCALFTSLFSNQLIAADITRGDIGSWLEQSTLADPPAAGTVIGQGELHSLHPWLAPGYREEFEFPHVEIEIQATGDYPPHEVYEAATQQFAGQATINADGGLENYTAGQPFTIEQITSADPATGGYMLAWNQIHRWQYYGYQVDELTMAYVGAGTTQGPIDA
ncbi:MAG: DUF1329 domain-containing protein, partial [Gammaproteobacteria bacterium]